MPVLEAFAEEQPLTIIHGDLRSANVLFGDGDECQIIDWGGLQRGKALFDIAYLLGTGMSASDRARHEEEILEAYHNALGSTRSLHRKGAYDRACVERDYRICLWLTAAVYAVPGIYDRGTETDENADAANAVRAALRKNLQPLLL